MSTPSWELIKVVRFVENSPSVNQLNISRTDIPCVLGNGVGGAARLTHAVTLHIAVNVGPPNLHNSPPSTPTDYRDSPAKEATSPGCIQFPAPKRPLPLPHRQPVEADNAM
jgi:hypothetical protein